MHSYIESAYRHIKGRRGRVLLFICVSTVTFMCTLLSALNLLAIPSSRIYALLLASITIIVGASFVFEKKGRFALILLIIVMCMYFISVLAEPRERRGEYESPMKSNTIVIEYDYASRPSIYRKVNFLFMTPIKFDFGAGYNETITHEIIWLSENSFKLTDYTGSEWLVEIMQDN